MTKPPFYDVVNDSFTSIRDPGLEVADVARIVRPADRVLGAGDGVGVGPTRTSGVAMASSVTLSRPSTACSSVCTDAVTAVAVL